MKKIYSFDFLRLFLTICIVLYYTQADLENLRRVGFIQPMTSLEDGVRLYVQNYLNKEDAYR